MSEKLNNFLAKKFNSPVIYKFRWLIVVPFVVFIAITDYLTGAFVTLSAFYLFPVLFIAWYQSRRENQLLVVVIVGSWGAANYWSSPDSFSHWMIIWNTIVRWLQMTIVSELFHRVSISYANQRILAERDSLTNLPNRRFFWSQLTETWPKVVKGQSFKLLAIIDVDHFKQINDANGHAFGDSQLQLVSKVLVSQCTESNFCGRLGGDEFALFLRGESFKELKLRMEQLALELKANACACSIGASISTDVWRDPQRAIEDADLALYKTKNFGRGFSTVTLQKEIDVGES